MSIWHKQNCINGPSGRYRLRHQSVWQATWPLRALGALSFLASGLVYPLVPALLPSMAAPFHGFAEHRKTQAPTELNHLRSSAGPSEARCSVRAKRGAPSERSEAPPPPTPSEARRCPRASRGPQTKAGMRLDWKRTNTERINILRSAGKRALHVRVPNLVCFQPLLSGNALV